ncbi:MAG: cyclic nucleotide-binding domain-containing protein [Spirochaetes bacterium]|nr:cyclic nucleotide-binding domain-containing protein [Spirochaetota bacterium]
MPPRILHYTNNEKIIKSGTLEQRMYIILEGKVSITLNDGNTSVKVAELGKGDFFGEISLFTNTPRSADVIAMGDVKLAYIDKVEELKVFLMRNPAFAAKMVQILCKRLAETDRILLGKISELNRIKLMRDV